MSNASYANKSTWQHPSCYEEEESMTVKGFKTLAYSIVIVLSLVGNALVIRIFYRNRSVRTTATNCFIVNMAASDIMLPIFVIPRHMLAVFETGPNALNVWHISGVIGELLCKLIPFVGDVSNSVSILTLVLISCDRYMAIIWPLSNKLHIWSRKRNFLIAATWIASLAIYAPYFYTFKLHLNRNGETLCILHWISQDLPVQEAEQLNKRAHKTYFGVLVVIVYLFPLLVISVLYLSVIKELRQKERLDSLRNHSSQHRRQRRREDNRVITMLVVVVSIFALFFAPIHLFYLLFYFFWDFQYFSCSFKAIHFSIYFLTLSTCCLNPYVYFIFIRKYRLGAKSILKGVCNSKLISFCTRNKSSNSCFKKCFDLNSDDLTDRRTAGRHRNSSSCRARQTENVVLASEHEPTPSTVQFETGV